jgi:NADPH:quinone reductase-like Zn-dependent oxidoreductase
VTGVTSTANVALVQSLGADAVIDYTKVDFTTTGDSWDIIFDTTGTVSFERCEASLKVGGRLVAVQGSFRQALGMGKPPKSTGKEVIASVAPLSSDDFRAIMDMASRGALKPVIDRTYRLEDVADAHAYVDTGRKRGSVVLAVFPSHSEVDDNCG